jgi:tyrosyl-tRNA synthetase
VWCRATSASTPRPQSLHVGSLIQIMMLRWLQLCGGKPIVLMGGGTTKVGDPSFRAMSARC